MVSKDPSEFVPLLITFCLSRRRAAGASAGREWHRKKGKKSAERNEGTTGRNRKWDRRSVAAARWDDGMGWNGRGRRRKTPFLHLWRQVDLDLSRPSVDLRFHSGAQTLGDEVIIIKVAKSKLCIYRDYD